MYSYKYAVERIMLQEWTYPELQKCSNEDIIKYTHGIGIEGAVARQERSEQRGKDAVAYDVGHGMGFILFAYLSGLLIVTFIFLFIGSVALNIILGSIK